MPLLVTLMPVAAIRIDDLAYLLKDKQFRIIALHYSSPVIAFFIDAKTLFRLRKSLSGMTCMLDTPLLAAG
jgi:hypothetical protein